VVNAAPGGAESPADDTPAAVVSVVDLRVRYGQRWALDVVSFELARGEVVGLLGPNGAGKTTTLSVLATLRRPHAGSVRVCGLALPQAAAAVRRCLGFVPQTLAVYPTLTARENLDFFARVLGLGRGARQSAVERALALVGLTERGDDVVSTFSGGMLRRLNLACGLLHAPRVLLLDEPTVGVDPQSRERIFAAVRDQAAAGTAVLYSTHYMEEAESLCDRVVLIDRGRVVASGTPAALVQRARAGIRLEIVTRAALPAGWLDALTGVRPLASGISTTAARARGNCVQVAIDDLAAAAHVLERAAAHGSEVLEFHVHQPDLQDVFIELTGAELRD
jgi:ABC-2 type transport system ATP-binding protein